MLPFLKLKKQDAGISTVYRPADEDKAPSENSSSLRGVEIAMRDLSEAHERKDFEAMARAFRAAFEMLESQPHEEAEHSDSE